MGMVGLAVDTGMLYVAHSRLQAAVDSGALAGCLKLPWDQNVNNGTVLNAARSSVQTNFPGAIVDGVTPGTAIRSVTVEAHATVNTYILTFLGLSDGTVRASATGGYNYLEVVLVIDNTGSMKGTPISEVRQASTQLVELLMPDNTTSTTKVGLVPFRGKVRVGAGVDGHPAGCRNADGSPDPGFNDDYMDEYWAMPSYYRRYVSMDTCTFPEIQPLSTDKSEITSAINSQNAQGAWSGTVISEGIKWGRHVLTPESPYTEGEDPEKYRKVMILLTDGDTEDGMCGGRYAQSYTPNNYWTNAYYGMGVTTHHCENGGLLNQAMLNEAQLAKDEGIEIFAIRFGSSDTVDTSLMKTIASSRPGTDDHYFNAPSVYDIDEMFRKIGAQLGHRLLH